VENRRGRWAAEWLRGDRPEPLREKARSLSNRRPDMRCPRMKRIRTTRIAVASTLAVEIASCTPRRTHRGRRDRQGDVPASVETFVTVPAARSQTRSGAARGTDDEPSMQSVRGARSMCPVMRADWRELYENTTGARLFGPFILDIAALWTAYSGDGGVFGAGAAPTKWERQAARALRVSSVSRATPDGSAE
jgi:hypothetical protein